DCWTELPDTIWNPLQRRLLDLMPGERIVPRALTVSDTTIPRRLQGNAAERTGADPASSPLAFLMAPGAGSTSHVAPSTSHVSHAAPGTLHVAPDIALFHSGGREAEIEEVFRRILAAGVSLDQVEIACASEAHVALVWEKALRHDWAVTLGSGIPAALTSPGRALIGLCDWIETDFSAGHFRRLLQSGDLEVRQEAGGFTAGQAARLLA